MTNWKIEYCAEQPDELQIIGKELYMQRRNIHKVTHEATEGMEAYTDWKCESREISFAEYQQLITDEAVKKNRADIDYIAMMSDVDLEEE